ncbi:FecR domain-containing protein [Aliifodinibius sp. S!AR15-10]|uniref:FecR family protein n=1 Tax=Aliifodinibius sp. S!AR15-10 TaxID=2950437 RepID=UPI002864A479|nr:FecR domain-containing protein [Aliifodinibius sp. S!AR15-10]MDR8393330.1 FecR domain-containing protein [Aliifodinibius sp. S!AR15-10]
MEEHKMLNLIRRYLSEECTPQEEQTLEKWLAEDADHREYFNAVKKVWDVAPGHDVEVDFEEEWKRISRRLGIEMDESPTSKPQPVFAKHGTAKTSSGNTLAYLLRVAAVVLIVAVPAFYFSDLGNSSEETTTVEMVMKKIETARGERASMEFSDGSQITLNSMSSVRFPEQFKGATREIYLEGEAFFKVEHNEDAPFIVHSNGVAVQVLGTEFNVNGYKEDEAVEVVVRDGKVAVKQNKLNEHGNRGNEDKEDRPSEVILTKGQQTLVKEGQLPTNPQNVSLSPYLAWVNGRMIFEGTPMRDVIQRLERVYDLNIEVQDSTLLSERLKASFKRETPEKVLGIISFSLGIDYELQGDTVIFKSKTKGTRNE